LVPPEDSHDGYAGASPHPSSAYRAIRVGRVLPHRKPVDGEPLDLLLELRELGGDARGPKNLRKPSCVLIAQAEDAPEAVGILWVGKVDLPSAGTVGDDPYPAAFLGDELVSDANAGKLNFSDVGHFTLHLLLPARVAPRT
jgi:hypothetical protein